MYLQNLQTAAKRYLQISVHVQTIEQNTHVLSQTGLQLSVLTKTIFMRVCLLSFNTIWRFV